MKKVLSTFVFISSLAAATFAIAAQGPSPQCTSGALNLAVLNQNLPSDDCSSEDGAGKYCIYNTEINSQPYKNDSCWEGPVLYFNNSGSVSFDGIPSSASLSFQVYTKGGDSIKTLTLKYKDGGVTDNCADVFGPDVQCVITSSESDGHPTYLLTISRK